MRPRTQYPNWGRHMPWHWWRRGQWRDARMSTVINEEIQIVGLSARKPDDGFLARFSFLFSPFPSLNTFWKSSSVLWSVFCHLSSVLSAVVYQSVCFLSFVICLLVSNLSSPLSFGICGLSSGLSSILWSICYHFICPLVCCLSSGLSAVVYLSSGLSSILWSICCHLSLLC